VFDNFSSIDTPDPQTGIIVLNKRRRQLPVQGWAENIRRHPSTRKSAPTTADQAVGTGPFKFESWAKGSAITLVKNDQFRDAGQDRDEEGETFRFINDAAAQVAALARGRHSTARAALQCPREP
jgi:peptide/nickel transport system substrate-binding protein